MWVMAVGLATGCAGTGTGGDGTPEGGGGSSGASGASSVASTGGTSSSGAGGTSSGASGASGGASSGASSSWGSSATSSSGRGSGSAGTTSSRGSTSSGGVLEDGTVEHPFVVTALPFTDARDTRNFTTRQLDGYSCSPATAEGGPEVYYRLDLAEAVVLRARVDEDNSAGVDVDIHVLDAPQADACLARGHVALTVALPAGTHWLVVDTFVSSGQEQAGPYVLHLEGLTLPQVNCATEDRELAMYWPDCAPGMDGCYRGPDSNGVTRTWLHTPATGPVVLEAHLVTQQESFSTTWPTSFTDGIANHYMLSQQATGYTMARDQPWAPAGEGGSEYGQGSGGRPPVLDEAWYINMYWRNRPAGGTRMIIRNPANGRAVVAAAGWETGPGANSRIGGASEEIHDHLGTLHLSTLTFAFAADQTLPLGPVACQ